jgi:hypothetical protein
VLRLSRESRWITRTDEAAPKPVTNDDLVIDALQNSGRREMATGEIVAALAGRMSERTVKAALNRLANLGKTESPRRGFWSLSNVVQLVQPLIGNCTSCMNSDEGDNSVSNYSI